MTELQVERKSNQSASPKKPMTIMEAMEATKERIQTLPPSLRPSREWRAGKRRKPSEAKAIARAVFFAVKQASESGYIKKNREGYEVSWDCAKS